MSIIEIVNHDEVIYRILDKAPPEPPKTPRYTSKYKSQLTERKPSPKHRNFGFAETPLRPPSNFLRKGKGTTHPVQKSDHKCCNTTHLPPVPKTASRDKKKDKPCPNFKVINIKNAAKTREKHKEPRQVDSRDGHLSRLSGSGKVPEYALRKDFGRIPTYLVKRNRRIMKELEEMRLAEEKKESLCKLISEEERQKLLKDLKHNWQLKQKAFLQLPIMTDTIPKILKKTKMEEELRELEKDIALVESNPYIYIYE